MEIGPCIPSVTKSNCLRHGVCAAGPSSITFQPTLFLLHPWTAFNFWSLLSWKRLHGFAVMQQPPRLVHPQGNVGSGAGQRSRAAPASVPVPPSTPRKKGEELDNLIRLLEDQYQLGFSVSAGPRSPATRKTTADILEQKIQFLFFSHRPALDDALARFTTTATVIPKEQRADSLLDILRSTTKGATPTSRSGTPLSTKNVPPKSLKQSQLCKCAFN